MNERAEAGEVLCSIGRRGIARFEQDEQKAYPVRFFVEPIRYGAFAIEGDKEDYLVSFTVLIHTQFFEKVVDSFFKVV